MQPISDAHFVSVVIPVLNEAKHIENCLRSLTKQDYPSDKMEIFVVDGMSTDGTPDIIKRLCEEDHRIKLLENHKKNVPCALNLGIKASKGDIIVRTDSHCIYPPHYVSTLVHKLLELDAWNVGGVWITSPANDSTQCLAIAICSSHPFGTGPSLHKIGCDSITETDTVPFGCFKREVFDKIGLFDEDMLRNEDEELNGRITRQGGKIFLIPEVEMRYMARDRIDRMIKMFYQYGLWKPLVNRKVGNAVSYRQFAPPSFVAFVILGLVLSIFIPAIRYVVFPILLLYLTIIFIIGIIETFKHKRIGLLLMVPLTFICIHFAYGTGYLKGFFSLMGKKSLSYTLDR